MTRPAEEFPPAACIYRCTELRELILEQSDVFDLWNHVLCCRNGKASVEDILKRRFRHTLEDILPEGDAKSVFHLLDTTQSAIVGDAALVMATLLPVPLPILEVATIGRDVIVWYDALWCLGYRPLLSPTMRDHEKLLRIAPGHRSNHSHMTFLKNDREIIKLYYYNRQSIIPFIISHHLTADMIFVTTDSIYCFYPRLLEMKQALLLDVRGSDRANELKEVGFKVGSSMEDFGLPCEEACLTTIRHLESGMDSMVAKRFSWMPDATINLKDRLKWQLASKCINRFGHGIEVNRNFLKVEANVQLWDESLPIE